MYEFVGFFVYYLRFCFYVFVCFIFGGSDRVVCRLCDVGVRFGGGVNMVDLLVGIWYFVEGSGV